MNLAGRWSETRARIYWLAKLARRDDGRLAGNASRLWRWQRWWSRSFAAADNANAYAHAHAYPGTDTISNASAH